jgi:putative ATPase
LARIIAKQTNAQFSQLSAIGAGVKDVRAVVSRAEEGRRLGEKTILFIDEIHRFNKAQQDIFLPSVEDGTIILIGATTENPSFEVNNALLSRSRVFVLERLESNDLLALLSRAIKDEQRGLGGQKISISKDVLLALSETANGDARSALSILEMAVQIGQKQKNGAVQITKNVLRDALQKSLLYDQSGEEHYNIISALHKSMRGGDANAALYWLARMLEGGEDPLYIARRLIRFASEDIGLANSFALPQAIAAQQACHMNGMPECSVNLAQAVVYMAKSKKSNALYTGLGKARHDVQKFGNLGVPFHLRNAPTKLMKELNYGKGYKYTPDYENEEDAEQEYFPEELRGRNYF